jgi:hypothetical protein
MDNKYKAALIAVALITLLALIGPAAALAIIGATMIWAIAYVILEINEED